MSLTTVCSTPLNSGMFGNQRPVLYRDGWELNLAHSNSQKITQDNNASTHTHNHTHIHTNNDISTESYKCVVCT